jgi:predicted RNA-binding Zn ribbon-like protein
MTTAHQHEATLEDALDFINTLHIEEDAHDHLAELGAGSEWLAQRGLLHQRRDGRLPGVDDEGTNARIRGCRDALRDLFDATVEGRRVSRNVLDELNRVLRHRELIELVPSRAGARLDHRHVGDPVDDALARLAEVLAREVGTDDTSRLRICANETCRWAFRDSSPTGRRRWCDMASCGNRAKAARHRARVRAAAKAPAGPTADALRNAQVARA